MALVPEADHRGQRRADRLLDQRLVGFGHYAIPGAADMVWWRHTHIVADIICGIAILGFALWAALRAPRWVESAEVQGVR